MTASTRSITRNKHGVSRAIIASTLLVLLLAVPFGALYLNRASERDLQGVPEREGTATVVEIRQRNASRAMVPAGSRVVVEFEGNRYQARQASSLVFLQPGKPARIYYRIGRSGQVYVDRVSPLR